MSRLLDENKVDEKLIGKIAKVVADFHAKARTDDRVSQFGSLSVIGTNWKENFDQTKEYVGRTLSAEQSSQIRKNVENFMNLNTALFEQRMAKGRIRDCHGDIHSGNIFITDKIYIFDAIEFNERFRYSDVAADVAFLAMDLDCRERPNLSEVFVKKYITYSGDNELEKLLPFYKCYRAYVRGKVVSFRLGDPNIGAKGKREAVKEAKTYFELALSYAKTL
jgi:aminoglycoside phosphotransferase family enzyme